MPPCPAAVSTAGISCSSSQSGVPRASACPPHAVAAATASEEEETLL